MTEPLRITAQEARKKVLSREALLVCAYDDGDKFRNLHLEGAISFQDFKQRVSSLAKGQEIIFYCA